MKVPPSLHDVFFLSFSSVACAIVPQQTAMRNGEEEWNCWAQTPHRALASHLQNLHESETAPSCLSCLELSFGPRHPSTLSKAVMVRWVVAFANPEEGGRERAGQQWRGHGGAAVQTSRSNGFELLAQGYT